MRELIRAIRLTLVLWVITAIIYPSILLVIGQTAFNSQANGSLITNQGVVVGSSLLGQPFSSDKYFWTAPAPQITAALQQKIMLPQRQKI